MATPKLTLIKTNLRRYTFESPKIKQWVESRCQGKVLNLFAGKTKLNIDETRVDLSNEFLPNYNMNALDFICYAYKNNIQFDTVIVDPPYSLRKSIEMYNGKYSNKFKQIADNLSLISNRIISFGYHSTFMGNIRNYTLEEICIFAHGEAQHCTIAIIETKK